MSPEQALGERLDERSDIFSLGTTFFHVFSGRLPFTEHDAASRAACRSPRKSAALARWRRKCRGR